MAPVNMGLILCCSLPARTIVPEELRRGTNYYTQADLGQQHTTLHPTAGLPLKLSRFGPGQFGPGQSLDGRPDAARSGVGGPVGGTLSSGLKTTQWPRAVIGDSDLCRVLSFRWDVK